MKRKPKYKNTIVLKSNSVREAAIYAGYTDEWAAEQQSYKEFAFEKRKKTAERRQWAIQKKILRIPPTIQVDWKSILNDEFVYSKNWNNDKLELRKLIWNGLRQVNTNDQGFYVYFQMKIGGVRFVINTAKASIRNMPPHKDGRNRSVWLNTGSARRYVGSQLQAHLYKNPERVTEDVLEPLSKEEKASGLKHPFERMWTLESSFVIGKNLHDEGQKGEEFPVFHFAIRKRMDSASRFVITDDGEIREHNSILEEGDEILTHYEWEQLLNTGNIDEKLDHRPHLYEYHEDDTDYRSRESWEFDDIESMLLSMAYNIKQITGNTNLLEDLSDRVFPTWNPTEEDSLDIINHLMDTRGFFTTAEYHAAFGDIDAAKEAMDAE